MHQCVNAPIYRSRLDAFFGLFVKGNNVLRFKNGYAFEMAFDFVGM
jgi:hypothetical protein